jgi:hypothetical protein
MMTQVFLREGAITRLVQGRRQVAARPGETALVVDLPDGIGLTQLRLDAKGRVVVADAPALRGALAQGEFPADDSVEAVRQRRAEAFAARSDPMIGPLLRGEITPEDFARIAAEIRATHPYPDEVQP